MAPIEYRYTGSGAPAVYNAAGAIIAILDACLVNGYGSKSAAGWAKVFSGTNKAVYRAPAGSERCYLRVDDSAQNYALVTAYNDMTDVDTGTGRFPGGTRSGGNTSYFIPKAASHATSAFSGSNYLPWSLISDDRFFILRVQCPSATTDLVESAFNVAQTSSGAGGLLHIFGEYIPTATGYRHSVLGACTANPVGNTSLNSSASWSTAASSSRSTSVMAGNGTFVTGSQMALNGGMLAAEASAHRVASTTLTGRACVTRTPAVSGTVQMSRCYITTETGAGHIAGYLPGLWAFTDSVTGTQSSNIFRFNDTFSGLSGSNLDGRTFVCKETTIVGSNNLQMIAVETSNTWYTP